MPGPKQGKGQPLESAYHELAGKCPALADKQNDQCLHGFFRIPPALKLPGPELSHLNVLQAIENRVINFAHAGQFKMN